MKPLGATLPAEWASWGNILSWHLPPFIILPTLKTLPAPRASEVLIYAPDTPGARQATDLRRRRGSPCPPCSWLEAQSSRSRRPDYQSPPGDGPRREICR